MWACVLLGHTPATWSAIKSLASTETNWASVLLISASNLFFILEILFAPSIRMLADRRATVVFILIVAMLHVGIIEHAPPELMLLTQPQPWLVLTALSATALLALLAQQALALIRVVTLVDARRTRDARRRYDRARDRGHRLRAQVSHWLSAPACAPPACLA